MARSPTASPPSSATSSPPTTPGERIRNLLAWAGAAGLLAAGVLFLVLVLPGDPRFTTAWTTAVFGLLAGGAALLSASASASSVATARRALGQQLYELARATHRDLTTGEVAAARDRLGALVRARRRLWASPVGANSTREAEIRNAYDVRGDGEAMAQWRRDWFTLLWCFQRLHAALVLLAQTPSELIAPGQQAPWDFLADLVRAQVRFLNTDATDIRAALEEHHRAPVDDAESAQAFRALVADLLPGSATGLWADPITTAHAEPLLGLLFDPDRELTLRGEVVLGDLRDEQFDALHRAVFLPNGGRFQERGTLGARLRSEAQRAEQAEHRQAAARLWDRAQRIETTVPPPEADEALEAPGAAPGPRAGS